MATLGTFDVTARDLGWFDETTVNVGWFDPDLISAPSAGAMVGAASFTFAQTGAMAGAGALAGTSAAVFAQTGTLKGAGALAGTSPAIFAQTGTGTLTLAAAGTAAATFAQTGAMAGAGALAGTSPAVFAQTGTMAGAGALAGTSPAVFAQTGTAKGAGKLIGSSRSSIGLGAHTKVSGSGLSSTTAGITTTAGSAFIVAVATQSALPDPTTPATDSFGNTYSLVQFVLNPVDNTGIAVWYSSKLASPSGGASHTFTGFSFFGGPKTVFAQEITGQSTVDLLDVSSAQFNLSGFADSDILTTTPNDLVFSVVQGGTPTTTFAWTLGFTQIDSDSTNQGAATASVIGVAPSHYSPSANPSGSAHSCVITVGLKASAPGFAQRGTLAGAGALTAPATPMTFGGWASLPASSDFPGPFPSIGRVLGATASGAMVGAAAMTFAQTGALTGVGALAGTSAAVFAQTGTMASPGVMVGTAAMTFAQTGAMTGAGALAGTSAVVFAQTGTMAGAGAMVGTAAMTFAQTGTGTLTLAAAGTAAMTFAQTGTLTGAGALTGTSPAIFAQTGTMVGAGTLAGTSPAVFAQTGTMAGAGALAGTSAAVFAQTGTLKGAGALAGTSPAIFAQTGTMAGAGALAGTAPAVFSASLNTNGSMTGTASFTFAASASITGIGAMVGSSPIAFSQTGNITGLLAAAGTSALLFGQTGTLSATAAMQATGTTVFGQTGNLVGISNTPTIIAVSSAFPKWQSTLTITVLNMSTAQGKVYIGGLLQAITLWNPAGTIQITVGRGTLQYGVNYDLIVKNDDGTPSPPWTVQLTPQTGWQYTVLTNPLAGVSGRLTGQPMDLAPGYIVAYGLALGTGSVTVRPDASFIVASTVVAFDAEAHNGIGWGAIGRETFV